MYSRFFKGVNGAAVNGVVSEQVANGLPAGVYRLCSINTDANHAPCLVAVAQHGSLDDCVYFSVGGAGNNNNPLNGAGAANNTGAANNANSTNTNTGNVNNAGNATNATSAVSSTAAAAASSAPPAVVGAAGKGKGKGKKNGRKNGNRRNRNNKNRNNGARQSRFERDN